MLRTWKICKNTCNVLIIYRLIIIRNPNSEAGKKTKQKYRIFIILTRPLHLTRIFQYFFKVTCSCGSNQRISQFCTECPVAQVQSRYTRGSHQSKFFEILFTQLRYLQKVQFSIKSPFSQKLNITTLYSENWTFFKTHEIEYIHLLLC